MSAGECRVQMGANRIHFMSIENAPDHNEAPKAKCRPNLIIREVVRVEFPFPGRAGVHLGNSPESSVARHIWRTLS